MYCFINAFIVWLGSNALEIIVIILIIMTAVIVCCFTPCALMHIQYSAEQDNEVFISKAIQSEENS